ncbi:hypothetical protein BJ875DRAFT_525662 [Amylocarpus encephaloides]|uniref:NAD-dependent epimerase/dehydratase domain-containing protein n=1 Tax=Amylocarpus encephaloides TaxID=45428 RepID=A0A9P8BZX8_9HELO|nr:hypothetical protein BJ875DRAFT_525662 [Amylocarpus encephaloides]
MAGELILITGTTGFIGFNVLVKALQAGYKVRIAVRREISIQELKGHALIKEFSEQGLVEGVVVPDITADGAYQEALKDVVAVVHLASPLPNPTSTDTEKDILIPAIKGTLSILNSALEFPDIRRFVITSSAVAIMTDQAANPTIPPVTYTPSSRITPLPKAPFGGAFEAYRDSKTLSLHATEQFLAEKNPHFTIINLHPGYVLGRNELATKAEELLGSTNAIALGVALGAVKGGLREAFTTPVTDLARIHIEALEDKVVGSQSFLIRTSDDKLDFNSVNDIAKTDFADAVAEGILTPVGSLDAVQLDVDQSATIKLFGKPATFREAVTATIHQYAELKRKQPGA